MLPAPEPSPLPPAALSRRRALALLGTLTGATLAPTLPVQAADNAPSIEPADQTPRPPITGYLMRYRLGEGSESWPADKRQRIIEAMDAAVGLYNQIGQFPKQVTAFYSPGTPTADGSYNGTIRFGGMINFRVALHELGHVVGCGTHPNWGKFAANGRWTGPCAQAQLRVFDGPDAVLSCDHMHFWPYGLNYDSEGSPENFRRHVLMLAALRRDMGITTGEAFRGMVGIGTWATQAEFKNIQVISNNRGQAISGDPVLYRDSIVTQDPRWKILQGQWKWTDGVWRQTGGDTPALALIGDRSWRNYTLTLDARKTSGNEGFLITFGAPDEKTKSWWNLGGLNNTRHFIEAPDISSREVNGSVETGRWYNIRVEVRGPSVKCYLDGKLVQESNR